jgi:hypothetical protein
MIGTFNALKSLCPTASFQLDEDNYDKLIWHSPEIAIPTIKEVEAEISRLQLLDDKIAYQRQRAPEYPDLKELADALYWNSKGDTTKLDEYYAKCEAVKLMYPKPE